MAVKRADIETRKKATGKHIDTVIVFYASGSKVVCHLYNTTQLILVNGHGYANLVNNFLNPFFEYKVSANVDKIEENNKEALGNLGPKQVRRSSVRYKTGSPFSCKMCDFSAKSLGKNEKKHKENEHTQSFSSLKSPDTSLVPIQHSTLNSILQQNLEKIENFTKNNQMKINPEKSKLMLFNKSRKYDFPPEMHFQDGNFLEYVEETRLLGIQLASSLSWESNTKAICRKAMGKMWLLRRLKSVKLQPELILDFYVKEVRPLLEQGVPIWNSGITRAQCRQIENIQKIALKIILDSDYISYEVACTLLNILPLEYRRLELATSFAIKLFKSNRSKEFFEPVSKVVQTRNNDQLVKVKMSNTRRCFNAPHNYLARLINANKNRIENRK